MTRAADQARVVDYGEAVDIANRVQARFDNASLSPETPGPELVVEAFVTLIETPFGQRPLRTVPTPATKAALEPYNAMAAALREVLAKSFGIA